jgi:hypothetical protein
MTYDELASALEDAWMVVGLHEHVVDEQISAERYERSYRAELFTPHDEPLPQPAPAWVEVSFRWGPTNYLRSNGHKDVVAPLELQWVYHVELNAAQARNDLELVRAFQGAVRAALRRVDPTEPPQNDYLDIEVRRAFAAQGDSLELESVEIIGSGVADLGDIVAASHPEALQDVVLEELTTAAAILHALQDVFSPVRRGPSGYRAVDTA